MEFILDNSTSVLFDKDTYNLAVIQDNNKVFLGKSDIEKLVDLCKEQNFLG